MEEAFEFTKDKRRLEIEKLLEEDRLYGFLSTVERSRYTEELKILKDTIEK